MRLRAAGLPHLRGSRSLPGKKVWQLMCSVSDTITEAIGLTCFLHYKLILLWKP